MTVVDEGSRLSSAREDAAAPTGTVHVAAPTGSFFRRRAVVRRVINYYPPYHCATITKIGPSARAGGILVMLTSVVLGPFKTVLLWKALVQIPEAVLKLKFMFCSLFFILPHPL